MKWKTTIHDKAMRDPPGFAFPGRGVILPNAAPEFSLASLT
jgi:hypothetical protein